MALFRTDLEALIYIVLIGIGLYLLNRVISYGIDRIKRILPARKNKINFVIRLISILLIVYFLIEGFPSFTAIPAEYTVIISGTISTAIAFATSKIFSNFISGILIWIVNPFDIGDFVKIEGYKGVIKSRTLTKVIIETLDRIVIEMSNSDIIASTVLNYTIKLKNIKNFYRFRRQIQSPQEIGNARLNIDLFNEDLRKQEENELRELHKLVVENDHEVIHSFTFSMRFLYERFRIKIDKIDKLCEEYKQVFDYKPNFHIHNFSNEIFVKFRILTLNSDKLLNYQADFANEIYKIILSN